jgi:branched-chain amino acid transport system ATP-binding protein
MSITEKPRDGAPRAAQVSPGTGRSAIFDVSFSVLAGSLITQLGANGAGKSTIARVVTGLVPVESGSLLFEDRDIGRLKAWKITRLGIVHAPEGRSVFGSLTVEENLTLGLARSHGRKEVAQGLERAYAMFPRLGERRAQHAGTLSGGEQRMLSLARVLVDPPRLLVVDELSLGLAPKIIDELTPRCGRSTSRHRLLIVEQYVARRCRWPSRSWCSSTARWCTTARSPISATPPTDCSRRTRTSRLIEPR